MVFIRELLFADDAALTSHSEEGLQHLVDKLSLAHKELGLTISLRKTNILAQGAESPPVITINNTKLEIVDTFTYLGSTVSSSTSLNAEISFRIAKAAAAMAKLNKWVWGIDLLSERTKMCIYQACVLSTLLYGSESWTTMPDKSGDSWTDSTPAAFNACCTLGGRTESPTQRSWNALPHWAYHRCSFSDAFNGSAKHIACTLTACQEKSFMENCGKASVPWVNRCCSLAICTNRHQCMGGHRQTPRYMAAKCQSWGFKVGSEC